MRRREFLSLFGGLAAALPRAAGAQQAATPVVGFINASSLQNYDRFLAAFLKGLGEAGYVEGRNVTIEYLWGESRNERLPALVAELIQGQVSVIAATSTPAALAARAATTTVPIVFETAGDPVKLGLVSSLNRPGGNATGVTQTNAETEQKRLELLRDLLPSARNMAVLIDPSNPTVSEATTAQMSAAARALGLQLHVLNASNDADLEAAFARIRELQVSGLVIGSGTAFFPSRNRLLAELVVRHAVPAIAADKTFVLSGGLMSYGGDIFEAYRLAGVYVGRVLKGEKPADLPVLQATKIELRINLKSAKALGIAVPLPLLGRADEIFE